LENLKGRDVGIPGRIILKLFVKHRMRWCGLDSFGSE
jgi:hypothetical protein